MNILLFSLAFLSLIVSLIFRISFHFDPHLNAEYQKYFETKRAVFFDGQKEIYHTIARKSRPSKKGTHHTYASRIKPSWGQTFNLTLVANATPLERAICEKIVGSIYPELDVTQFLDAVAQTLKEKENPSLKDLIEMSSPHNETFYQLLKKDFESYFVVQPLKKRKPLIFHRTPLKILQLILPPQTFETLIKKENEQKMNKEKPVGMTEFEEILEKSPLSKEEVETIMALFVYSIPEKPHVIQLSEGNITVRRKVSE